METISRKITYKKQTEILIAGSGIAGLCAAISAAEKGAEVTVIEKRDKIGGISITGMGIFAVESRLQKLKNHPLTKEDAFHFFMDCTHWQADAKLVAKFINRSAQTIDWFEKMGVEFSLIDINWGQHAFNQTGHLVCTPEGPKYRGGVTHYLIDTLYTHACELGVTFVMGTELEDLIKENDKITHVITRNKEGEFTDYTVKAAIIASGGYSSNDKMMNERNGRQLNRDYFVMHNIPMDGKGIELAWKMGAGCDGMALQQGGFESGIDHHACPNLPVIPRSTWLTGVTECPVLYVNLNGKRFIDEGLFSKTYKANAIARQKDKVCYAILDERNVELIETEGVMDVGYMSRKDNRIEGIKEVIEKNAALGTKYIVMADSLEELAEKCHLPKETFIKTVNTYNAACDNGWDKEFGKKRRYLNPVREGKFYALLIRPEGYGTVGGIKINENAEVCTDNDDVISGLYAAGDCANGAVSWDYSLVYTLWGSTLGLAANTGRFAGESAADYIQKI